MHALYILQGFCSGFRAALSGFLPGLWDCIACDLGVTVLCGRFRDKAGSGWSGGDLGGFGVGFRV